MMKSDERTFLDCAVPRNSAEIQHLPFAACLNPIECRRRLPVFFAMNTLLLMKSVEFPTVRFQRRSRTFQKTELRFQRDSRCARGKCCLR